ncbi:MAG: DNA methyltransferase [Thermoproteota archaeon]
MMIEEMYDLGKLVTFVPNKRLPIYNWFYFKEGFSRDFVMLMLNDFGSKEGDWVLDPFCGVGTTILAAKEKGLNAFGVDVSPLFVFVSQAKVRDYDITVLRNTASEIFNKKFIRPNIKGVDPFIRRAFSRYTLEDILFFRSEIEKIQDSDVKSFFTLALMNASMKASYVIKDGAVIRFHKKPVPPFRKFFRRVVRRMIRQVNDAPPARSQIFVRVGDSRRLYFLEDQTFDIIITSPPYLNKIEYTEVYSIEYSLFFGHVKIDPVRSYIGLDVRNVEEEIPGIELPDVAKAYFRDMKSSLEEMYRVLKIGGKVALVVAGGVFPNMVIDSDLLLARLAEDIGFEVTKIVVVNKRAAFQERKIGEVRESILLMNK